MIKKALRYYVKKSPYLALNKYDKKGELIESKQTFRRNKSKIGFHYFKYRLDKLHIEKNDLNGIKFEKKKD